MSGVHIRRMKLLPSQLRISKLYVWCQYLPHGALNKLHCQCSIECVGLTETISVSFRIQNLAWRERGMRDKSVRGRNRLETETLISKRQKNKLWPVHALEWMVELCHYESSIEAGRKHPREMIKISAGLRFWRPWRTEKNEAPLQILKFEKIDFHLKIL